MGINRVVYLTDDNYVMPTCVSIVSVFESVANPESTFVYIVGVDLNVQSRDRFFDLQKNYKNIELIDKTNLKDTEGLANESHVSTTALYKFYLGELFESYSRILYLDCDVVMRQDVFEVLSQIDLKDKYAAVVKDIRAMVRYVPNSLVRLGVSNHRSYFNSGVMYLNLEKMRADKIFEKLLAYKRKKLDSFMDQDALNVCFEDKLLYLPPSFNFMTWGFSSMFPAEMESFYGLENYKGLKGLLSDSYILHFTGKWKPWEYSLKVYSKIFKYYYMKSPYKHIPLKLKRDPFWGKRVLDKVSIILMYIFPYGVRGCFYQYRKGDRSLKVALKEAVSAAVRFTTPHLMAKLLIYLKNKLKYFRSFVDLGGLNGVERSQRIVVSFTSIPSRIKFAQRVMSCLLHQTLAPDVIVLYLDQEIEGRVKLPWLMRRLIQKRLVKVRFVEDIGPHTKYFYAMQDFPEDVIITVDDDVDYPKDLVRNLFESYNRFPDCISANRVHRIRLKNEKEFLPYNDWAHRVTSYKAAPSHKLIATGVGGVLYPPGLMDPILYDKKTICELCPFADDIWLKFVQLVSDVKVVSLRPLEKEYKTFSGSQKLALWKKNNSSQKNDDQINNLYKFFSKSFESERDIINIIRKDIS